MWQHDGPEIFKGAILAINWRPLQFNRTGEDPFPLTTLKGVANHPYTFQMW
jgi:hypothetical protein